MSTITNPVREVTTIINPPTIRHLSSVNKPILRTRKFSMIHKILHLQLLRMKKEPHCSDLGDSMNAHLDENWVTISQSRFGRICCMIPILGISWPRVHLLEDKSYSPPYHLLHLEIFHDFVNTGIPSNLDLNPIQS